MSLPNNFNHNQNLFLIVSYCFCPFGEGSKAIERQVWRVRVVHLHSAVRELLSPSQCFQIVNKLKICFIVLSAEMLQQFWPTFAKRLLTSYVFLSHSETLHCENKIDKSFDSSINKIEIFSSNWLKASL